MGDGSRRDRAARRAALWLMRTPMTGSRIRTWAGFQALGRSTDLRDVQEAFQVGLNKAVGSRVRLEVRSDVDPLALRQLAMTALSLLNHFRVTELRDLTISSPAENETRAAVAYDRVQPDVAGSRLWFNADLLTRESFSDTERDWVEGSRRGKFAASARLGLAGVTAHEVGHLISFAARRAAAGTEHEHSLQRRTVESIPAPELNALEAQLNAEYDAAVTWLYRASPEEIVAHQKEKLEALGLPVRVQDNPEHIREELLAAADGEYRGQGRLDKLAAAIVTSRIGPYAAGEIEEQKGDGFAIYGTLGERSDEVSRETNAWIMEALGRPPHDRAPGFVAYNEKIVGLNNYQRAKEERARTAAQESNPWLTAAKGANQKPAPGASPVFPPMPNYEPTVTASAEATTVVNVPVVGLHAPPPALGASVVRGPVIPPMPATATAGLETPTPPLGTRTEPHANAQPGRGAAPMPPAVTRGLAPARAVSARPPGRASAEPPGGGPPSGTANVRDTQPRQTWQTPAAPSHGQEVIGPGGGPAL